jgi:hypothetical protein
MTRPFDVLREVAGVRIPDSTLAVQATELAYEISDPYLFNHVMRSYLFGALLGQHDGLQYDPELFYLAAVLHDLGLTSRFAGPRRFEVEGAEAARDFLLGQGVDRQQADLVWDAVALHASVGIAPHKGPEAALTHLGAGVDVVGLRLRELPAAGVEQVLAAFPRLQLKRELLHRLIQEVAAKPGAGFALTIEGIAAVQRAPFDE